MRSAPPAPAAARGSAWAHAAVTLTAATPLDAAFTPEVVASAVLRSCEAVGLHVVGHLLHCFEPQGASLLVHGPRMRLALHTWPERGVATLDVLCLQGPGEERTAALVEAVRAALGLCVTESHQRQRGAGDAGA